MNRQPTTEHARTKSTPATRVAARLLAPVPVLISTLLATTLWLGLLARPARADDPAARIYTEEEAWQLGWPSLAGPLGNFLPARTGVDLVEDLANARLVWESEDRDFGRAKHTTGTFKAAGNLARLLGPEAEVRPGAWAGPIIAEGKLFATSFRPSGPVYQVKNPMTGTVEPARLEAEDLLIALDARTGKLLWKAAEPGGFVWGVGKRGGFQVAPVCSAGKVFSMGTTGRIFAYDAATGRKLWQRSPLDELVEARRKRLADPSVFQVTSNGHLPPQSLVAARGVLIVPRRRQLMGVDMETGQTKWQLGGTRELPEVISRWATPSVWRHQGREYLLAATGGAPGKAELRLIDPADGRVLWTFGGLHPTHFSLAPSAEHVAVNVGSKLQLEGKKSPTFYGRLGALRLSLDGAQLIWSLPDKPQYAFPTWPDSCAMRPVLMRDGLVYYVSKGPSKETDRRFVIADERSGRILAELGDLQNTRGYQLLIEDRLLVAPDWAHGSRAFFDLYTTDPKDFRQLCAGWQPPQPLTTAYMVFLETPVVAGRIFLRTQTGTVVCYDLRDTPELKHARTEIRRILALPASRAAAELAALSHNPYVKTRRMAVEAIGRLGEAAAGAVPGLTQRLEDEADEVRRAATNTLAAIGQPAAGPLVQAATDASLSPAARRCALLAAVRIGPEEALPEGLAGPLVEMLREAEYEDAQRIAAQLARIGPPAVPALVALLKTQEKPGAWRAAFALGEIGPAAAAARKELESISRQAEDPRFRETAQEAIAKIRSP